MACSKRCIPYKAIITERKIEYVAVYSPKKEGLLPCGACLQVIKEFATDKTKIVVIKKDEYEIIPLVNLLPSPFTFD